MNDMLWFDDTSKLSLASKITRGADHYEARRGRRPTRVTIHPTMLLAEGLVFENRTGLRVDTSWQVEPCYFAFGFDEPEPEAA